MSKGRSTKVPTMRKSQPYADWKKELKVWQVTNTNLEVDEKIQAGILFESLEGISRETVLSELTVDQLTAEDGVQNIISTLDHFFKGNENQNAYSAIDDLLNYKCDNQTSMEHFIVEFQMKVNKVKASGTVLPEGVLGYTLLKSANLSVEKHDMIKATCNDLTFKNVKIQLEKIGFARSTSKDFKFSTVKADSPKVKIENCYYGNAPTSSCYEESQEDSSEEDLNGEKVFYSEPKSISANQKKYRLNPTDRFGHVRSCSYCKCLYHWLVDCPYAPASVKSSIKRREI